MPDFLIDGSYASNITHSTCIYWEVSLVSGDLVPSKHSDVASWSEYNIKIRISRIKTLLGVKACHERGITLLILHWIRDISIDFHNWQEFKIWHRFCCVNHCWAFFIFSLSLFSYCSWSSHELLITTLADNNKLLVWISRASNWCNSWCTAYNSYSMPVVVTISSGCLCMFTRMRIWK